MPSSSTQVRTKMESWVRCLFSLKGQRRGRGRQHIAHCWESPKADCRNCPKHICFVLRERSSYPARHRATHGRLLELREHTSELCVKCNDGEIMRLLRMDVMLTIKIARRNLQTQTKPLVKSKGPRILRLESQGHP